MTSVSPEGVEVRPSIHVVSGDPHIGPRLVALLVESHSGAAVLYRAGADCLRALAAAAPNSNLTVVIDGMLSDVTALNLADAIRSRRPDANVILVITPVGEQAIERAMLVGARAVVERTLIEADFLPTVRRVVFTSSRKAHAGGAASDEVVPGACVVVAGACGGAGRSTVSTLLAWASAQQGADTALVDFDLQFGDLAFLLDSPVQSTMVDLIAELSTSTFDARSHGRQIRENLTLYSPSPHPEQAELVAPMVRRVLRELQAKHDFVVVNTGAFWTLFHAELLDSADHCVLVLAQTAAAIRATTQAKELCKKLGVPDARVTYLMNRVLPHRIIGPADAAAALEVFEVLSLPDGGQEVPNFFDAGDIEGLVESRNVLPPASAALLNTLRQSMGLSTSIEPAEARKPRFFGRWVSGCR